MDSQIYLQCSRYSQPIIIFLGTIGALLNQILFRRQKSLRTASCSLYFRTSSLNDLFVLYMIVLPQWLQDQYRIDLNNHHVLICKIRTYLMYCLYAISPYCIVLGCFDRLCRSSRQSRMRQLATLPIARQMIFILIMMIFLLYSHILYQYTITNGYCHPLNMSYFQFLGYFLLIFYCLLPPILMSIFCGWTFSSLDHHRRQQRSQGKWKLSSAHRYRRHRDYYLIKLLFLYVVTNIICILPFTLVFLFNVYKRNSDLQLYLMVKLTVLLANANYCASFYVYTLGTPLYRREVVRLMKNFCCFYS